METVSNVPVDNQPLIEEINSDDEDDIEIPDDVHDIEQIVSRAAQEEKVEKDSEKAKKFKEEGNIEYKANNLEKAVRCYSDAIAHCPDEEEAKKDKAIYYCNRAACYVMMDKYEEAVDDCTKSIELNPTYANAYLRRGKAYQQIQDKVSSALADMRKVVELNPTNTEAVVAVQRLEVEEKEHMEKQKDEMLGKLKDLGNGLLGKFGLSLDNFKSVKDPKTGGYSVSFQK